MLKHAEDDIGWFANNKTMIMIMIMNVGKKESKKEAHTMKRENRTTRFPKRERGGKQTFLVESISSEEDDSCDGSGKKASL